MPVFAASKLGRLLRNALLCVMLCGPAYVFQAQSQSLTYDCSRLLRSRVGSLGSPSTAAVLGEPLRSRSRFAKFYEPRIFWPAWSEEGVPLAQADSLVAVLRRAEDEGLSPAEFHLDAIRNLLEALRLDTEGERAPDPARSVDLDLLCTDALLTYGSQLLFGRTPPPEALKEVLLDLRGVDLVTQAERAVRLNGLSAFLERLVPVQGGYRRLREALARYRGIADTGGWLPVKGEPALRRKDAGERVRALRQRLAFECDSCHDFRSQADSFDLDLELAVKEFQQAHGLPATGVVDASTAGALNVPVEDRIRQLEVNLERWRWLPRTPLDRCVIVNVAGFSLRVVERDSTLMAMRVIVGKEYKPTPVLASEITHVVLNPRWNVPREIGQEEIFPLAKKDSSYLERNHYKVYAAGRRGSREVDPAALDWSAVDSTAYWFQQQPGPLNALGPVKFVFRNAFDVAIHGTPSRALFRRPVRQFSHGCIRAERPMQLAEYVLRGTSGWTRKKIDSVMESSTEHAVRLRTPVPVYLLYLTAWADESGPVQFRNDVYRLDEPRYRALGSVVQLKATLPKQ